MSLVIFCHYLEKQNLNFIAITLNINEAADSYVVAYVVAYSKNVGNVYFL